MPSLTFRNLPASKKNAFTTMAFEEFAHKEYHEASISNIVRNLDIAKGSVYQYFSHKLDLFEYLTLEAHKKLIAIQDFVDTRDHEDIGSWFIERNMALVKFTKEFPSEFELLCRVNNSRNLQFLTLKNQLRGAELDLIQNKITPLVSNQTDASSLSFVIWSVIQSFLQNGAYHQESNDIILQNITDLSHTLFEQK